MVEYIESMLNLILGDYFFQEYEWAFAFREIVLFFLCLLMIYLTYKLWKYLLIGWWHK